MNEPTIFTAAERIAILGTKQFVPDGTLQSAIDYHEAEITKLDAMGFSYLDHEMRKRHLEQILANVQFNGKITIPV